MIQNLATQEQLNELNASLANQTISNVNTWTVIGYFNSANKFTNWTAPKDCVVTVQIAKNNTTSSQNTSINVDGVRREYFLGMSIPYSNATFYISMKQGQVLTIPVNGDWAYHEAYISYR